MSADFDGVVSVSSWQLSAFS